MMGGLDLVPLLAGGDRRSIGRVPQVVRAAARDPGVVPALIRLLGGPDPVARMRAADALEKATRIDPTPLRRYRIRLLRLAAHTQQPELRWHLAQLLPRLGFRPPGRRRALRILRGYLRDPSAIVRTFALQAMVDLTAGHPGSRAAVRRVLRAAVRSDSPAVRARARRLLAEGEPQ
jgi:HEAT repeat protein